MNIYNSPRRRAAFGITAVGMTAAVMALSIIVPASLSPRPAETRASSPVTARTAVEADIVPARIDVFGVRETKVISIIQEPKDISLKSGVAPRPDRKQG